MKTLNAKKLFLIAFLILVVTNLIILLGVYNNRSGEAESQLTLTERELQVPYWISKENSGLSLRIVWSSLGKKNNIHQRNWQSPVWLDSKKLKTLGYDIEEITKSEEESYRYDTSRESYIVLEYDGEAYQEALKRAQKDVEEKKEALDVSPQNKQLKLQYKRADSTIKYRKEFESRLYAVDAGNDPVTLRERYPDRSKYIISKGLVHLYYNYQQKSLYGNISNLTIPRIHVPLEFKKMIEQIVQKKQSTINAKTYYRAMKHAPRYRVTLAYGKRYEPWVVSIEAIEKSSKD